MKKIIITFLAGIIYLTNLGAQSYLYDKGSSGASLGVTRISGIMFCHWTCATKVGLALVLQPIK